jgi:hypothetical protein
MNFIKKLFTFVVVYSIFFFLFRFSKFYLPSELKDNLNGISWLYSVIGLIFGIISAFIIQTQWNRWDNLTNAARGEIDGFRSLLLLSNQFPDHIKQQIKNSTITYLNCLLRDEGWRQVDKGERSETVENAIRSLQDLIFHVEDKAPKLADISFSICSDIVDHRNNRLHYSSAHLPYFLKITVNFSAALIIFLALFVYVPNIYFDYMYKISIGLLSFLLYTVINDLDHPYRPGNWHLTNDSYKQLLESLK